LGEDNYFFAVYDGHGSSGREASQTANDYISSELEKGSTKGDFGKF
jgi:serine/threonine protein phosphatase PrpC